MSLSTKRITRATIKRITRASIKKLAGFRAPAMTLIITALIAVLIAALMFIAGCSAGGDIDVSTPPSADAAEHSTSATLVEPVTTATTTEYDNFEVIEDIGLEAEFLDIYGAGGSASADGSVSAGDGPPVAQVAGRAVTQSEYRYMLNAYKGALLLNSGLEAGAEDDVLFWERTASNGMTRLDEAREKVFSELHQLKICEAIAEDNNFTLDADDLGNISTDLKAQIDRFGSREEFERVLSDEYGISLADYWRISVLVKLREKLYSFERDSIVISEGEMLEYYVQNSDIYGDMVMVRAILFLTEGAELKATRTAEETERLAGETLDALKAGADMDRLILERSEDPNLSMNGGEYIATRADSNLPDEVLDWAFGAQDGDYAIVETSFGAYVVYLERRVNRTFEDMKSEISDKLREKKLTERVSGWLADPDYALRIDREVLDSIM